VQQTGQQVQIEIDELTARGLYVNAAMIAHTGAEFLFDFVFLAPQQSKVKVLTRLISSPSHTKQLLLALQENVKRYEAQFGEIKILPDQQRPIAFPKAGSA